MFEDLDFDKEDHTEIENYTNSQLSGKKAIDEVILMKKCKDHQFHAECLEAQLGQKDYLNCSICMITYGIKTGDMPNGTMTWALEHFQCSGYSHDVQTWEIQYNFPSGRNAETGIRYNGDSRVAYLPDTQDGREVLALLVKAFRRKLTFTVGFSVVRG